METSDQSSSSPNPEKTGTNAPPVPNKELTQNDRNNTDLIQQQMSEGPRRLHVTFIPFRYREDDLYKLFEPFGAVSEVEVIYNERGSKGYGFVTMVHGVDAIKAREALNGKEVDGRRIEVNNATPRAYSSSQGTSQRGKNIRGRGNGAHHNNYSRAVNTNGYNSSYHNRYQVYVSGHGYSDRYGYNQSYNNLGFCNQTFPQHNYSSPGGYVQAQTQGSGYYNYRQGYRNNGPYRYQPY